MKKGHKMTINVVEVVYDEKTLPGDNELVWVEIFNKKDNKIIDKIPAIFKIDTLSFKRLEGHCQQEISITDVISWKK